MWALVVTVCLSGGHAAECKTWIGPPRVYREDCAAMMSDVAGPVAKADTLHIGARCVLGRYA